MEKTKYTGVYVRTDKNKIKTYYIKYKIKGRQKLKKIGTNKEGITAVYASNMRAKEVSTARLSNDAPMSKLDNKMTFDEAFKFYYEYTKHNVKDHYTTNKRYEKHVKDEIGHMELQRIDKDVIENLKKTYTSKINPRTKKPYSEASINHLFDLIRATFNYMISEKNLSLTNPASATKMKRLKVDNKRERYLELEEIEMLFSEIEKEFTKKLKHPDTLDKLKTLLMLSFSTGARLGSVITIKSQDMNFNQKTITIKNHKTGKTYTEIGRASCRERVCMFV